MKLEVYARYNLGKKRVLGQITKLNTRTAWVTTPNGNVIKRNMKRHNVVLTSQGGVLVNPEGGEKWIQTP